MRKGILVEIYKDKQFGASCSNDGISSKNDSVLLIGEGIPKIIPESSSFPTVILDQCGGVVHGRPIDKPGNGYNGWMFGGSFIFSFHEGFPFKYPIKLHDRRERC